MTSHDHASTSVHPASEAFEDHAWLSLSEEDLGPAARVPTMLSPQEQRLYLWLASRWAKGIGAAVDLGAFAGGSTACLAEGLARAGHEVPVFAFDRFRVSDPIKERYLYPTGLPRFDDDDLLPHAKAYLAPWKDLVHLCPGDIETATWSGGPIEILAIDAAKSAAAADRIAEVFFPNLLPGRSVVIHQDFLFWKVPWLPAQMEWLADFFHPVAHCPNDTVVFLCTETPETGALERARVQNRGDRELRDAIASTRARLRSWNVAERLDAQEAAISLNPNARRARNVTRRPDPP